MNLAAWAERNGVARVIAYRWFRAGLLPVPARRVGRLILVDEPAIEAGLGACPAVYARVCSADQKADLDRPVTRVTPWATDQQIPVDNVVTEVERASPQVFCVAARSVSDADRGETSGPVLPVRLGVGAGRAGRAGPGVWLWWTQLRLMTIWCVM
jgi:hypothetical protein